MAGDDDYHIFRMTIKDRGASGPIPYSESFNYENGQQAVYALVPGLTTDTFDYPNGALVGSGFWGGG